MIVLVVVVVALVARRRVTHAVAAAVVFGIVFANPFGVVTELSAADPRPLTPTEEADRSPHWVKVAGIPIAWFTPYNEEYQHAGLYENSPTSALKLRYGFSFLPSTGASTVLSQCNTNSSSDPCWTGERGSGNYPLVQRDVDGGTWIVPISDRSLPNGRGGLRDVHIGHFYEVGLGIASKGAIVYWLLVAGAICVAVLQSQLRWRLVAAAATGSVAVGLVAAGFLAIVPLDERGVSARGPTLLPKPADAPAPDSVLESTVFADEPYDEDCVTREDGTTTRHCARPWQLTAGEADRGVLVFWTSRTRRDFTTELRVRRLSATGEPLAPSAALLPAWPGANPPGTTNCEIPDDLQTAPLPNGETLVAWLRTCGYGGGTGPPAVIAGVVVDARGGLVRGPFVVAEFQDAAHASTTSFRLGSTAAGRTLLVRTGLSSAIELERSLFASILGDDQREGKTTEIATEGSEWNVEVACGRTCVVAQGLPDRTIELSFLSARGALAGRATIGQGTALLRSRPAVAAVGEGFVVGWLESEGVDADAWLASVRPGRMAEVVPVAEAVANGTASYPSVPQPLGLTVRDGVAGLVWQTSTGERGDERYRLHHATVAAHREYAVDADFAGFTIFPEATVARDLLVTTAEVGFSLADGVVVKLP